MPLLGFGTWQLRGTAAYQAVRDAIDVGYRHIDTATSYGNEAQIGAAIRDSGVGREELFVTTKCPPGGAGRERTTLEASLRDLATDYVDLWLVHWPPRRRAYPPMWKEFIALRDEGKARAIGVSNYSTGQIDKLVRATSVTPAVNQIPWSPWLYEPRRADELRSRGVVLEGYSPLKRSQLGHAVLAEVAGAHRVTPAQVVLRWHVDHGFVVIPKSSKRARIEENFAIHGFALSPEEREMVDALAA